MVYSCRAPKDVAAWSDEVLGSFVREHIDCDVMPTNVIIKRNDTYTFVNFGFETL